MRPLSIKILSELSDRDLHTHIEFNMNAPWQSSTTKLETLAYEKNNVMLSDVANRTFSLSATVMDQGFAEKE